MSSPCPAGKKYGAKKIKIYRIQSYKIKRHRSRNIWTPQIPCTHGDGYQIYFPASFALRHEPRLISSSRHRPCEMRFYKKKIRTSRVSSSLPVSSPTSRILSSPDPPLASPSLRRVPCAGHRSRERTRPDGQAAPADGRADGRVATVALPPALPGGTPSNLLFVGTGEAAGGDAGGGADARGQVGGRLIGQTAKRPAMVNFENTSSLMIHRL